MLIMTYSVITKKQTIQQESILKHNIKQWLRKQTYMKDKKQNNTRFFSAKSKSRVKIEKYVFKSG